MKLVCFSFFVIRHSSTGEVSLFFVFRYSFFVIRFSFFDIRTGAEFRILTFKILFLSGGCRCLTGEEDSLCLTDGHTPS